MNDLAAELRYRREQRLIEKSRRVGQTMAMDAQPVASTASSSGTPNMGRVIGKDAKGAVIVAYGGEWFYRKDGDVVRYGPYKSPAEAIAAARAAGLNVG